MHKVVTLSLIFNLIIIGTNSCQIMLPSSSWSDFAGGKKLRRKELVDNFVHDCMRDTAQNEMIPLHEPNQKIMRIATYNIHQWRPPHDNITTDFDFDHNLNFDLIMKTLKKINADIIILQEVLIFNWPTIKNAFESLGYTCSLNMFMHMATCHNYPFGHMIIAKNTIKNPHTIKLYDAKSPSTSELQYGFVKTIIDLPHQKKLILYGTYLDVEDETENLRYAQIKELIDNALQEDNPCLIAADFNAIREQDYQYMIDNKLVWELLNNDHQKRVGFAAPTKALELFKNNDFLDCFSRAHQPSPKYSVWNGTLIDFIWLNKKWDIPIVGCYVYYSIASDHLPIIMDIQTE